MHVSKPIVHHISKEYDGVGTRTLRDAPCLAEIHVDEDACDGSEKQGSRRVGSLIKNLWIGHEKNASLFTLSLLQMS